MWDYDILLSRSSEWDHMDKTQVISCSSFILLSFFAKAVERADSIARQADIVAALSLEVLKGTTNAFDIGEWLCSPHLFAQKSAMSSLNYFFKESMMSDPTKGNVWWPSDSDHCSTPIYSHLKYQVRSIVSSAVEWPAFSALDVLDIKYLSYFREPQVLQSCSRCVHHAMLPSSEWLCHNIFHDAFFAYRYLAVNYLTTLQVHGVVNDTLEFVRNILHTEINSATDNPVSILIISPIFFMVSNHGLHDNHECLTQRWNWFKSCILSPFTIILHKEWLMLNQVFLLALDKFLDGICWQEGNHIRREFPWGVPSQGEEIRLAIFLRISRRAAAVIINIDKWLWVGKFRSLSYSYSSDKQMQLIYNLQCCTYGAVAPREF